MNTRQHTVNCTDNHGYSWSESKTAMARGFMQLGDERTVYRDERFLELLDGVGSYEDFIALLANAEGSFACLLTRRDELWIAVDHARSMPLYFTKDGHTVSDSAEAVRKSLGLSIGDMNEIALIELYEIGCVVGNQTTFGQIVQLDAGQCARLRNETYRIDDYYIHNAPVVDRGERQLAGELARVAEKAIRDTIIAANGRPLVLSLSGGYDSRFIACMLKRMGIDDVSCYTYGDERSPEVIESRKVAKALGYRWAFVEHDDERVKSVLNNEGMGFIDSFDGHDFTAYLQNYIAVKVLHEQGWFQPDSVFITGLCHDMPTGFYVQNENEWAQKYTVDSSGFAHYIRDSLLARHVWDEEIYCSFEQIVLNRLDALGITICDYQEVVSAYDAIITGYVHSKRFLHMNKAHAWFGYEWLLPCWNKSLLEYWYSLPFELRIEQYYYEKWLMEDLFDEFGVNDKKIYANMGASARKLNIKRAIGGLACRVLYPLGIPLRRGTDYNNWALLEVALYKRIKNKKAVNYRRASLATQLTIWLIERRYTPEAIDKYIIPHIRGVK